VSKSHRIVLSLCYLSLASPIAHLWRSCLSSQASMRCGKLPDTPRSLFGPIPLGSLFGPTLSGAWPAVEVIRSSKVLTMILGRV
jgi:hypothetical protein